MARRGHDVTVLSAGREPSRQTLAEGDGTVTTIRLRQRFGDGPAHERWFGLRILPELARGRFDAVHCMMPRDAVAAIRLRRFTGSRVAYEELGNPHRWWWERLPDGDARRRVARQVDVYGCMSAYAQEVLEQDWSRPGSRMPGGVRLDQFVPSEQRSPVPTVLFAGAVADPRKGLPTLLEAIDLLHGAHPSLELWVSGDGDIEPLLRAAPATVRGHIRRLEIGAPDDQGERYARAWCTALPSSGDSFGMVLIESLASGTPIVVADDGAPPELVEPGCGAVSRLGDAHSLAEALVSAFDQASRSETAERCRAIAARYDWDAAIAPHLEALYTASGRDPVGIWTAG